MKQADVTGVVEALPLGQQAGLGHERLDFHVTLFGHMRLLRFLVNGVVATRNKATCRHFLAAIDKHEVGIAFLSQTNGVGELHDVRRLTIDSVKRDGFTALINHRHAVRRNIKILCFLGLLMLPQLGNQLVDLRIKIGAGLGRTRDNEWRTRLINENRVDLIHNREIEFALYLVFS